MKILLGGVPLGCDNIGDEAIVGCVVGLLRKIVPESRITVCTRDREGTAKRLEVETAPLYGFAGESDLRGFEELARRHDVYIWFGATGLSDYPETALRLLRTARKAGVPSIVWGVGMNSELNPAFYRAAGMRRKLLHLASRCSFGVFDFISFYESLLRDRTMRHVREELSACELVVLRDEPSVREVEKCGFFTAVEGADTAILQSASTVPPLSDEPGTERIGFCISEQSAVRDLTGVRVLWDKLLESPRRRLVLIPMNPVTDRRLMLKIASECRNSGRIECLDSADPAVVQACAGQCRVLVSSRLHLLILGANAGTPGIGIERGSKIANWLMNFGDTPAGTVELCDFEDVRRRIERVLALPEAETREEVSHVMAEMRVRLDSAAEKLRLALIGSADRMLPNCRRPGV